MVMAQKSGRCDLRVNECNAPSPDKVLGVFSYKGTSPPT